MYFTGDWPWATVIRGLAVTIKFLLGTLFIIYQGLSIIVPVRWRAHLQALHEGQTFNDLR
jgi:hypothetical protein